MSTVPKVYAAINAVQKVLAAEGITKSRRNTTQNYQFRGIDDMYNVVSGIVAEKGLCILPRCTERVQEERVTQKGNALFYTTVKMEFDFVSVEDGSKHTVVMYGEAMDSADKSTNKSMSAAFKYAVMQSFQIPTIGDNDADASTPPLIEPARQIDKGPPDHQEPARKSALVNDTAPARSPLWDQLVLLLDKYGKKRPAFEKKIAESFGIASIGILADTQLPEAITRVMTHQAAASKPKDAPAKKAPAKKAPLSPPVDTQAPDLQQDDSQDDDGIPL